MTFGPFDTLRNFSIIISDDDSLELDEEFKLEIIIPPISAAIGIENRINFATGRILSDDSKPMVATK